MNEKRPRNDTSEKYRSCNRLPPSRIHRFYPGSELITRSPWISTHYRTCKYCEHHRGQEHYRYPHGHWCRQYRKASPKRQMANTIYIRSISIIYKSTPCYIYNMSPRNEISQKRIARVNSTGLPSRTYPRNCISQVLEYQVHQLRRYDPALVDLLEPHDRFQRQYGSSHTGDRPQH